MNKLLFSWFLMNVCAALDLVRHDTAPLWRATRWETLLKIHLRSVSSHMKEAAREHGR